MNITMHWERSWKDEFAKRIERDGRGQIGNYMS